jgi:hypothetical protein
MTLRFASVFLLLFFAFSFIFRTDTSFNQDLGRHLKTGEIIVKTKSVPRTNTFSYTNPDFPFINHHWLFQVMAYTAWQSLGLNSLLILKLFILLLAILLTLLIASSSKSAFFLPLGFIFLHTLRTRIELRPEVFSFLFTSLTLWILYKFVKSTVKVTSNKLTYYLSLFTSVLLLPLIQLLWVNTHIYFLVGLMLQAIFLVQLFKDKAFPKLRLLGVILFISCLVTIFNPNGLEGSLMPLKIFSNYGYTIQENQTIFFLESLGYIDADFLFVKLILLICLVFLVVLFLKKKLRLNNFLLIALGVGLSLMNVRSFPYLFFLTFPALMMSLDHSRETRAQNLVTSSLDSHRLGSSNFKVLFILLAVCLIFLESLFYLTGAYYLFKDKPFRPVLELSQDIKEGADFMVNHNLPRPILNNFDIGGYIIYRAYPNYPVFVDGRPEAFPKQFFQAEYTPLQSNPKDFQKALDKYQFKTIIFSITDQTPWGRQFLKDISQNKDFQLVYLDHYTAIWVKVNEATNSGLKQVNLDQFGPSQIGSSSPSDYLNLAVFFLTLERYDKALEFDKKLLELNPESRAGNLIMAQFIARSNSLFDQNLANQYFQRSQNLVFW